MRENIYLGAEAIVRMMQEARRKELAAQQVPIRRDLEVAWSIFLLAVGAFAVGFIVYLGVNW